MTSIKYGTDYTGKKFGHMTAVSPTAKRNKWGARIWVLQCECGVEVMDSPAYLKAKNANCGCLEGDSSDPDRASELIREWLSRPIAGVGYESA